MSDQVTFDAIGQDAVLARLKRMRERASDLRPAWRRVGDLIARYQRVRFRTEGAFPGTPRWAPLTPEYAAWKLATYGPKPILQREGDLIRSLTSRPMDIERYGPRSAEYGTSVPYAHWHQTGTSRMVARPPLATSPALAREIGRLLGDHIVGDD